MDAPDPMLDALDECMARKDMLASALGKMGGHLLHLQGNLSYYIEHPGALCKFMNEAVNSYQDECHKLWPPKEGTGANDHG